MPDRTQEIKNLRQVFTASVNYTNEVRDDLRWELGTYDLLVDTINGTTMLLPTPTNTIQASMVRVDGNSEVSENLIVLNDVAETTTNGITYNVENGILTYRGTPTVRTTIELSFPNKIDINHDFYFKLFNAVGYGWGVQQGALYLDNSWVSVTFGNDYYIKINNNENTRSTFTKIRFILIEGNTFNNTCKPMLVKGSTAPTEFKVGYEGIHNLELSGLKVEGSNKINQTDELAGYSIDSTTGEPIQNSVNGCSNTFIQVLPSTTYTLSTKVNCGNLRISEYSTNNASGHIQRTAGNNTNAYAFTTTANTRYVKWSLNYNNQAITQSVLTSLEITLNIGSTALPYEPYVSQTLPIDLSTILYNGSPLFEGNCLKGYDGVADSITPYKATKRMGIVDLGTLDYTYNADNYQIFASGTSTQAQLGFKAQTTTISAIYTYATTFAEFITKDKCVYLSTDGNLYIRDSAYTDATTFKTAMSGVYLVYELATPIEVSIDFSQLVKFEAHSNGSITLVNTNNQDTTSTFKYLKEVAK